MASALILGAGSDIAVEIARALASAHFDLFLAGRDTEFLETLKQDLRIRYDVQAQALYFDALDYASHAPFFRSLPSTPDVTVCAFGYLGDQEKGIHDWSESARILDTNFTGAVSILNVVADAYEAAHKGTIVGISSVAGERGRGSNYLYGSAKAGFSAYLSGLRNRLFRKGVHVISVKPGFVATKMTAHLKLPPTLTATPGQVGRSVLRAIKQLHNTVYVKGAWKWIMLGIRMIPENVFKKMNL